MKKLLDQLTGKKFDVYIGGEVESTTNFLGFMRLLADYSDFFLHGKVTQKDYLEELLADGVGYIDANITVKMK